MEVAALPAEVRVQVEALDDSVYGRVLMPLVLGVIESAADQAEASDMLRVVLLQLRAFMYDDVEALLGVLAHG